MWYGATHSQASLVNHGALNHNLLRLTRAAFTSYISLKVTKREIKPALLQEVDNQSGERNLRTDKPLNQIGFQVCQVFFRRLIVTSQ